MTAMATALHHFVKSQTNFMKIPQIEISVKYTGAKKSELKKLNTSRDVAQVMRELLNPSTIDWIEEFVMLCLNQERKVIGYYKVSVGGFAGTYADIKVIATIALQCAASSVIVAHNHPSGSLKPSPADIAVTQRIKNGLALLDIKLIDHIIVTDESYYSFTDEGNC